jgi:hypothetical protein
MIHVAAHKDGDVEAIVHRLHFPGKNTGWLGVGEHDNVWLVIRGWGYWITHLPRLADDLTDGQRRASLIREVRQIADGVMATEGSMDEAFRHAADGLRDGRAGYKIFYIGGQPAGVDLDLAREAAKNCVRRHLRTEGEER